MKKNLHFLCANNGGYGVDAVNGWLRVVKGEWLMLHGLSEYYVCTLIAVVNGLFDKASC